MSSFNVFNIKRAAHTVSRESNDQTWNPFRHVYRRGPSQTWDASGSCVEEQLRSSATSPGARPSRALSEPLRRSTAGEPTQRAAEANSPTDDRIASRAGTEEHLSSRGSRCAVDVEHERLVQAGALRNRRRDDESSSTPEKHTGPGNLQNTRCSDEHGASHRQSRKKGGLIRHVRPKHPFTLSNQLQRTLLNSWINILLLAAPVGIAINYVSGVSKIAVFVINFVAIIPLAAMLSFATEEIALRTGETLGGLLNATFGNAVELIVAVLALIDNQIRIVQTSLIGSILSNLLLVMGCCFFFGGLRRPEQFFNQTVAQTSASLLALAVAAVIVPTVFDSLRATPTELVAKLSRGTAVILLLVYGAYLFFQLKTHQAIFNEESKKVPAKPWSHNPASSSAIRQSLVPNALMANGIPGQEAKDEVLRVIMQSQLGGGGSEEGEGEEEPQLHFGVAIATLTVSTIFIALCAEFMVDGIHAVTSQGGLSEEFVGLILLPIVGNAAEHATAMTVAIKDKMDLSLGVAIGSSMQVSLFIIPLLVIIGWGMGKDAMNLSFDEFQVTVMFVAVLLTNYLIGDGKSHWLEGFLLICLYAIIAVCAFFYPNVDGT